MIMDIEKVTELIFETLGYNSEDIGRDTLLVEIISDEYEMQELLENVGSELNADISVEPLEDWTLEDLAKAIAESV